MKTTLLLFSAICLWTSHTYSQDKIEYIDTDIINQEIIEYAENENYEQIIQNIEKINKNDSLYNTFLVTKSYYLIRLEKYKEALKATDEGLSSKDLNNKHSFLLNKGLALSSMGNNIEAIELYDTALNEFPKSVSSPKNSTV